MLEFMDRTASSSLYPTTKKKLLFIQGKETNIAVEPANSGKQRTRKGTKTLVPFGDKREPCMID